MTEHSEKVGTKQLSVVHLTQQVADSEALQRAE